MPGTPARIAATICGRSARPATRTIPARVGALLSVRAIAPSPSPLEPWHSTHTLRRRVLRPRRLAAATRGATRGRRRRSSAARPSACGENDGIAVPVTPTEILRNIMAGVTSATAMRCRSPAVWVEMSPRPVRRPCRAARDTTRSSAENNLLARRRASSGRARKLERRLAAQATTRTAGERAQTRMAAASRSRRAMIESSSGDAAASSLARQTRHCRSRVVQESDGLVVFVARRSGDPSRRRPCRIPRRPR